MSTSFSKKARGGKKVRNSSLIPGEFDKDEKYSERNIRKISNFDEDDEIDLDLINLMNELEFKQDKENQEKANAVFFLQNLKICSNKNTEFVKRAKICLNETIDLFKKSLRNWKS